MGENKFLLEFIPKNSIYRYYLTSIKASCGRIIIAFTNWEEYKMGIIYSDSNGITWSNPIYVDGGDPPGYSHLELTDLNLTESSDNKILLCFNSQYLTATATYYRSSTDWGETWSEATIFYGGSDSIRDPYFVSLQENKIVAFFNFNYYYHPGIYKKISNDGGITWSEEVPVMHNGLHESNPKIVKITDTELWLIFQAIDTLNAGDIYYSKSFDGGDTWNVPTRFTRYAGFDNYLSVAKIVNKPFITFSTTRFTNNPQIAYAILGETIEKFRPPYIASCSTIIDSVNCKDWFVNCYIIDDNFVKDVFLFPEAHQPIELFDDGKHYDKDSADNFYGNKLTFDYFPPSDNCIINVNKIKLPMNYKGEIAFVDESVSINTTLKASDFDNQQIVLRELLTLNFQPANQFDEGSFLFAGGFFLSGYTNSEMWTNGVVSSSMVADYIPGKTGTDPANELNKIYVVRKNDSPFGYSWQQWKNAVSLGADFYDGDNDGLYNPKDKNYNGTWEKNEDMPLLLGDETAWCIYNDGLPSEMRRFNSVNPQGIEIQQTVFASNNPGLENTIFIRYSILNTGTVNDVFDSVYFGVWKDPDLGDAVHNYISCDTSLNADFVYNKDFDQYYGVNSPSFFTTIMQGPIVQSFPGDTGYNNSGIMYGSSNLPGYKNLNMSAHVFSIGGDPQLNDPDNPVAARYLLLGKYKFGNYPDPCDFPYGEVRGGINCNEINPAFWLSGDPVSDVGWISKIACDVRNLTGIGPFKLIKDKPQDIIIAYVLGRGTNPINSITVARENVRRAIQEYKSNFASMTYTPPVPTNPVADYKLYQNYPNPFNPITRIRYQIPEDGFVTVEIFDILGQRVKTLLNKFQKADRYEIEFNGSGLASGVYIYRMKVNDFITSKKMVLVK